MNILERLKNLTASSAVLRDAYFNKEAGFGTALLGLGKSIANKGVAAGSAMGKGLLGQAQRHGPATAALGAGMGMMTASAIPKNTSSTYKNNKAGFKPETHKAQLGMEG